MANKKINSVNLLPEFLRTEKNAKFLSSTIDQLIQPPQLERIDGFVGSTKTPTFNPATDIYLNSGKPYQLSPALVTNDNLGNIQRVQGYEDLINEIGVKGGITNNLDRLFRSEVYSYNAHVDWDKLVNFQYYYWMPNGPDLLEVVDTGTYVVDNVVGMTTATVHILAPDGGTIPVRLTNGMLISFSGVDVPAEYYDREFFVEGVGTSIVLVDRDKLLISEEFVFPSLEPFDSEDFDNLPFDNDRELAARAEYVTINRASRDLNSWSRYNRWVHQDVIKLSAELNNIDPEYPKFSRAQRPIIEFKPNIQLFDFGSNGIEPIDLYDERIENLSQIEGSTVPVEIDDVVLEEGYRVIFSKVSNTIYKVRFDVAGATRTLRIVPDYVPENKDTVTVLLGTDNNSTDWWFNGTDWIRGQQRRTLNQAPLFDLYDVDGRSYSDRDFYLSDFRGNKIFSYIISEDDTPDKYLGYPISYRNTDAIGSILFENNLMTDSIVISQLGKPTYTISTNVAYIKIGDDTYENAWVKTIEYEMPLLSSTETGITSYYEEPLSLTNNPLNGSISKITISELYEHVQTMINRGIPQYTTSTIGASNLRDLPDYTDYGINLISSANPIAFAQMFIGKKENNVIDSIIKVADQYNQFKHTFLNSVIRISAEETPAHGLDLLLTELNQNKNNLSPYFLSDMVGYGSPEVTRSWTVSNPFVTMYPLETEFDLSELSLRSVLVYLNDEQLIYGVDYTFDVLDSSVNILRTLEVGDVIVVNDFKNTEGAYIPPTPTKLGLYPKFVPSKFIDNSYVTPTEVIQGHDGSITVAYGDYRDDLILELEKRIYNNIKSNYNSNLLDINSVIPGVFRTTDYSLNEVTTILQKDFIRWAGQYSIDYAAHKDFDPGNAQTWNYFSTRQSQLDSNFNGSWRAIFNSLYDTDRPNTHPWEMLGFSVKPDWFEDEYGVYPWTSSNDLWTDLEAGYIAGEDRIDQLYARPGLSNVLPVDSTGDLVIPNTFVSGFTNSSIRRAWSVGDQGPAETAWRRSSYWPFAVQRLLALTIPATYTSLMYDPSRVQKNISDQWTYGVEETFFRLPQLKIHGEHKTLTSGYSVFVSEVGSQRTSNYISELRSDLAYVSYNLFYKVGGFVDKDTLQVVIDAFEPTSTSPGSVLPPQNYELILNSSNPIKSIAISGLIIQRLDGQYVVKGYDQGDGYFNVFSPIRNLNTPAINVGGISAEFVKWEASGATGGATGLNATDTISANSAPTGRFYQQGQYVQYGNNFYRCTVSHRSGSTFNTDYFQILKSLPTIGGVTVQTAGSFDNKITQIPYGVSYASIQDVYDLIIGYGRWLTSQGFDFSGYNATLESVIDWDLTAKEFLFWTTQNWADGSVITLSPFADKIVYKSTDSVVANLFDSFYQYSIMRADGTLFPQEDLSVTRSDSVCTISTLPETDGIYFARLNLVQKEHAMVFDNETIFSDTIYNTETGSRQRRIRLVGFKTAGWNGDFFSPGFVYDTAVVRDWNKYTDYLAGDVVRFGGNFYSAIRGIDGAEVFDFTKWQILNKKPTAGLLPNFDYKINQFEDFYSLDSDNFDEGQQSLAQHLTGYTPRPYLNNIFPDPTAQYKFYQGFIREKGTRSAIDKLSKASLQTLNGEITFNEEWAFRLGNYGSFTTYQELEVPLVEGTFLENPQVVNFVDSKPASSANDLIHYSLVSDLTIVPNNYKPSQTFVTTSSEDVLLLTHSGYIRLDDVTATAYNESSLLDIANSSDLKDGDTIWLGFKQDGDWDVFRYTYSPAAIIGVYVSAPLSTITFTTQYPHGLEVGQLIGVSQFNEQVNGIYRVQAVQGRQFTVPSTLASIENAPLPVPGQLYKFVSARLSDFDNLPSDKELFRLSNGTKFWIDPSETNGWEVYEKINNYVADTYFSPSQPARQGLGHSISKRKGSDIIVVGAPTFFRGNQYGQVYVYIKNLDDSLTNIVRYRLGGTNNPTDFGACVLYDDHPFGQSTFGLAFAGAPIAFNSGVVKVSAINDRALVEGTSTYITNPDPSNGKFGTSIFVERNTSTKLVVIGAPGGTPSGTGAVHAYRVTDSSGTIVVSQIGNPLPAFVNLNQNSQWGYSISGADNASVIAVGAPGYFTSTGVVTLFDKSLQRIDTVVSPFGKNGRFGESIAVSPDGSYMVVSAPTVSNDDSSVGKVAVYKIDNTGATLDQVLENPVVAGVMKFGYALDINTSADTIAISALGTNNTFATTFDNKATLFDGGVTKFTGTEPNSGAVYIYYRQNARFVLSQELSTSTIATTDGTDYGSSIVLDDNEVLVGAPAYSNTSTRSAFYKFDRIDSTSYSWDLIRNQEPLVNVKSIQKVALIDTASDSIVEYLDVIDPLKGKIAGIADQELTYKLVSDPAIYSIGVAGVNTDTTKNWLDDHVGELWWDLSSAKYVWYEQSDLEYRRNNWGKLFPGAMIDVYEWVGSSMLPSEWSAQADTPKGLTQGVSGQPKFVDNSVISVKQVYDQITNSFSNMYYYWVKNKVTIPNAKNRRISSYEVGSIIADPSAYGLKFVSVIAGDAVAVNNVGPMLINDKISLNIAQDTAFELTSSPKHTEWLLMQEGSADSMPPIVLEKKLLDSLLGHDPLGNLVPDPSLSDRTKYGIGVRPQQSMFNNRLEALRNIVEFSNGILKENLITNKYSFDNLNAQEEIPNRYSGKYDFLPEDRSALATINTSGFRAAVIDCQVDGDGEITKIRVLDSGYGYGTLNPVYGNTGTLIGYQGPTFETIDHRYVTTFDGGTTTFDVYSERLPASQAIYFTPFVNDPDSPENLRPTEFVEVTDVNMYGRGIEISTVVDATGSISTSSFVTIKNPGKGYKGNFKFLARPHTAYVLSDDTYNGKWTQFEFDYTTLVWNRSKTQSYNTPLYWNYIDWASSTYDDFRIYTAVIGSPYELGELQLQEGQYVKINNGGDGRYIVLEKTNLTTNGTYGNGYNVVYSQNGTLQISDTVWDLLNSGLGWDFNNTYDETLYDQTPDLELQYILKALKEDIFIDALKVNWNLLFFKAIKYAFTEQKLLDWAFKTSFISVLNKGGALSQPPVYKLQNSEYYENYINEVKPYHTQIRNFITEYSLFDDSRNQVTDFDFPAYYDTLTNILVVPNPDKDIVMNEPVRRISSTIRFDRISSANTTGDFEVADTFIANGNVDTFVLNWVPNVDRSKVTVRVNGIFALYGDYKVETYTEMYNGYHKQYGRIVFLRYIPEDGTLITVEYEKYAGSLNAVERIINFTNDIPSDVMTGIDYPGLSLSGGSTLALTSYANTISGGIFGFNPDELIINGGEGFLSPISGHAPEEFVPGHVTDSLGVSVYTKGPSSAPIILTGSYAVVSTSSYQQFVLSQLPPTIDSLSIVLTSSNFYGNSNSTGRVLTYTDNAELGPYEYSLNWETKEITIPEQYNPGILAFTIIGVGSSSGNAFGLIDKGEFYAINATTARVDSGAVSSLVQDALVTVDGVSIPRVSITSTATTSSLYFKLLSDADDNDDEYNPDQNVFARVYNLSTTTDYLVQAWFFAETADNFNEIKEQTFSVVSRNVTDPFVLDISTATMVEPLSTQAIVEITDQYGTRRLLPPDTKYYQITTSTEVTFPVSQAHTSTSTIRVYKNGNIASFASTSTGTITIIDSCQVGDAIAIESYLPELIGSTNSFTTSTYDYRIEGNLLFLAPSSQMQLSSTITNATIKVVTYNDRDSMMMQKERIVGNPNRRFRISRPILNTAYVWVTLYKKESVFNFNTFDFEDIIQSYGAVSGIDFIVLEDNVTIQFNDNWEFTLDDIVEVTSFMSPDAVPSVLGYRIFNDMSGGTTFTRLSSKNTTYLTRPLRYTDTEIHVADETVLTPPDLFRNIPGIVMIDGERIEFWKSQYNVLSDLRRGTMGTGPAEYSNAGTRVLDQGTQQIIPGPEVLRVQNTFTNIARSTYVISTATIDRTYPNTSTFVQCDGIIINPVSEELPTDYITFNNVSRTITPIDQIDVYYGGRKLRKDGFFKHDTTVSYDGISPTSVVGSVPTEAALTSVSPRVGNAYIVTATNQVWVYTGLRSESTATRGFVYSGLNYIPADFSIDLSAGQTLTLNTATIELVNNRQITIVKKETTVNSVWNNTSTVNSTVGLIDSDTAVVSFLKESPADLPDNYYYGGDLKLTDENGEPLVDFDGRYITGYN